MPNVQGIGQGNDETKVWHIKKERGKRGCLEEWKKEG